MIFTPEELQEIAVKMLGWEYVYDPSAPATKYAYFYKHGGTIDYRDGIDFSAPEWTGLLLAAVLPHLPKEHHLGLYRDNGVSIVYNNGAIQWDNGKVGLNRNLYDAWKWLRTQVEATDVQS